MATSFQVTFDAADPHRLAAFWAAALGYAVEEHGAFIRQLMAAGVVGDEDVEDAGGLLRWRTAAAIRDPEGPVDERGVGHGRRLLFQQVPEAKTAKNRVHLDLNVGKDHVEAEAARLAGLGATLLHWGEQGGNRWATMADPEGNELCVQ